MPLQKKAVAGTHTKWFNMIEVFKNQPGAVIVANPTLGKKFYATNKQRLKTLEYWRGELRRKGFDADI